MTEWPRLRVASWYSLPKPGTGRCSDVGGVIGLAPPGKGFLLIFRIEELSSLEDRCSSSRKGGGPDNSEEATS